MILLVDIGNTNIKMRLDEREECLILKSKVKYDLSMFGGLLPLEFKTSIDGAIISSVVPESTEMISSLIKEYYEVLPLVVDSNFKTKIEYKDSVKKEIGSDMFSALDGASILNDTFLSIDMGTGTTFNLVINNKHIGTTIAPGLMVSHNAFIKEASLIDEISLEGELKLLGDDTISALISGTVNGFTYLVDGFIDSIKKEYKLPNLKVFLSGGNSRYIINNLRNKVDNTHNLIFMGLAHLYKLNEEK